jgi:predicted flap endonuclease-1-like 5' DNA nuclease
MMALLQLAMSHPARKAAARQGAEPPQATAREAVVPAAGRVTASVAAAVSPSAGLPQAPRSGKARAAAQCELLEQIPNIGSALADDLRSLGVKHPRELANKDAFVLYQQLCAITGQRQDPCVLDTFMAATDFMRGAPAAPWWHYTAHRKLLFGQIETPAAAADSSAAAPNNKKQ